MPKPDDAAVDALIRKVRLPRTPMVDAIYQAGIAEGLRMAAEACDKLAAPPHTYASENSDRYIGFQNGAERCAQRIRALAKP